MTLLSEANDARVWLANKWITDIRTHNRAYDENTLVINVEAAVIQLTDAEVISYVNTLRQFSGNN